MAKGRRPGNFRHHITVHRKTETADGMGGQTVVWAEIAAFPAVVEPLSVFERSQAQQIQDSTTHKITTRYRSDITITAKDKIVWGSREFSIVGVINEDERNHWWVIRAHEGVAV